jgi:hypothetical protein
MGGLTLTGREISKSSADMQISSAVFRVMHRFYGLFARRRFVEDIIR